MNRYRNDAECTLATDVDKIFSALQVFPLHGQVTHPNSEITEDQLREEVREALAEIKVLDLK